MGQNSEACETCGAGGPYNIKKDGRVGTKRRSYVFSGVSDPVQDEIKSLQTESVIYKAFPIIPYLDNSDATLRFFRKMKELSPTHGSCINSIRDYVLGGQFVTVKKQRQGFSHPDNKPKPVSLQEHENFCDFIESFNPEMSGKVLMEEAEGIFDNFETYGTAWLKVERIQVGSEKQLYISNVDTEKCRYLVPDELDYMLGKNTVLISSSGFKGDPDETLEFINEYPYFTDYGDGREATIISLKNKVSARDWYGLPNSMQSLYSQFMEVQGGEYMVQGYANRWTAKVFIETVMDEEDEISEDEFADNVEEMFSAGGEARQFLYRNRLKGDEQSYVYEFTDKSDHETHETLSQIAERQIIKSHNWSPTLLGISQPGKLGQNQEFKDIFKVKYFTVIQPFQKKICDPFSIALKIGAEFFENAEASKYSLGLNNLFADILEAEKGEESNSNKIGE